MSSVLVVSRNPTLGMWLSRNGFDVDEVKLESPDWVDEVPRHAALLLDVGTVDQAEQRLNTLLTAGLGTPVVLVGDQTPPWATLAGRFTTGLALVTLPLDPAKVLDELGRFADGARLGTESVPVDEADNGAIPPAASAPDGATPLFDSLTVRHHPIKRGATAAPVGPAALPLVPHGARSIGQPTLETVAESGGPVALALLPPDLEPVVPLLEANVTARATRVQREVAEPAAPPIAGVPQAPTAGPSTSSVARPAAPTSLLDLLAALQERVTGLYSVREVAEFVLAEMVERCEATAGAALMHVGDGWVVEAGVGLRALEGRLLVPADHWLVRRVIEEELGLLVTRSDGSGHELVGVPLASWEHLAAVYLPQGRLLVLLASNALSFDDSHLKLIRDFDEESKELLHEATAVRELARSLLPLVEDPNGPYST